MPIAKCSHDHKFINLKLIYQNIIFAIIAINLALLFINNYYLYFRYLLTVLSSSIHPPVYYVDINNY